MYLHFCPIKEFAGIVNTQSERFVISSHDLPHLFLLFLAFGNSATSEIRYLMSPDRVELMSVYCICLQNSTILYEINIV